MIIVVTRTLKCKIIVRYKKVYVVNGTGKFCLLGKSLYSILL